MQLAEYKYLFGLVQNSNTYFSRRARGIEHVITISTVAAQID